MAIPLLPFYLTTVLGAGALTLGWIEGMADAVASLLKLVSGRWSDRIDRRRPFILAGYGLSSLIRPFLGATSSAGHVLLVRLIDRTGKGLRNSPRDALIARSVDEGERAAAFGLNRALDHAGAVLGPLVAAGFLFWVSQDVRVLFWLTAIPGAMALALLIWGVREVDDRPAAPPTPLPPETKQAPQLWRFLLPLGLFTLGNASDVFLLLKAGGEQASITTLPLLWMGLHIVKSLSSIPGGRLADRIGRRRTIAAGWVFYAAVYAGFAFADTPREIAALFVVYGLYHGLTEGAERALVADLAPARGQGTAFGWYHLTLGLLSLAASLLFGGLWDAFGSHVAFLTSAGLALIAALSMAALASTSAKAQPG
ncbi:MAG: MFS transporter [Deltaproteobacteria bacterium]|nr:MFS transporter [Deltaproteobacteria bacterium]MBW2396682.1 MFS transporter [Deltaproteobacteria bacterium]